MNSGAKAAIAVVGIIIALFLAGAIGLVLLGAIFYSQVQTIQPAVRIQGAAAPAFQRQNVQQGDVIMGIDGQIVTMPDTEKAVLLNKSREITVEVNGENLKITPNISD